MATHNLLSLSLLLLSLSTNTTLSSTAPHHHQHRRQPPTPTTTPSPIQDATPILLQACNATLYPSLCLSTLSNSSLPSSPSPSDLLLSLLLSSSHGVSEAASLCSSLLPSSNPNLTTAAHNCQNLLSLSSHRLSNATLWSLSPSLDSALHYASAALLYQYDCWSALKYVNTTSAVATAMAFLDNLTHLTSLPLSLLTNLRRFGSVNPSRWVPPQTERDGYWPDPPAGESRPDIGPSAGFPTAVKPNVTVCKDRSCRFGSVQAAVDSAPEFVGPCRYVVYIKEGVYEETVRIPFEKTNLVFVGDGMGKTVITGSLSADMVGVSTYNTATVGVTGDGFMARDLTFQNTAGPDAHQAVAFRSDSDLSVLESVEFAGHQDTLYAHSLRQFYKSCLVSGTVDFIFGNSATVFQDTTILFVPRILNPAHGEVDTVTAHGRTDPGQTTGFVFRGCVVNATDDYLGYYHANQAVHRAYLGRPWKAYSRTVFIECYLGEMIRPEGWSPWDGDFATKTLFYGEYGNTGPGANVSRRVLWSNQIPAEHVAAYSVQNFIQGNEWIPSNE